MFFSALRTLAPGLVAIALLLPVAAAPAVAQTEAVLKLTLQYQQSDHKVINEGTPLFGHYLGTGDGVATGTLQGTVDWDLYEDQSRDDLHPAHFRGFIAHQGTPYAFQLIGVYTPEGQEQVTMPDGREHSRHWALSGTIVFEDPALLGMRQALVTGSTDLSVMQLRVTVWGDHEGTD